MKIRTKSRKGISATTCTATKVVLVSIDRCWRTAPQPAVGRIHINIMRATVDVVLSGSNILYFHQIALALQEMGILKTYFTAFSGTNDLNILKGILPSKTKTKLEGKHLDGLNLGLIKKNPLPYLISRMLLKTNFLDHSQANLINSYLFDLFAMNSIKNCDVFHSVHESGLKTFTKVKKRGVITVCDVRSSHIKFETEIFKSEFDMLGLHYNANNKPLRNRAIEEYEMADYIIVPSKFTQKTLINNGILPAKIKVIPYGVDFSRFSYDNKIKNDNKCKKFKILFVGNGIPGKGLHYLINAFSKANIPNSELNIVGWVEPKYKKILESYSKDSKINYIGHIPQIDPKPYYNESNIFVLPSLSEGLASVIIEAMAAGLPVITTPNAGVEIIDGINGFIVPIRDSDQITLKLEWCYKNLKECKEIGLKGKETVENYSWVNYRNNIINFYTENILKLG